MSDVKRQAISVVRVSEQIWEIRGEQVILDSDVAERFGTTTRRVNEAVKRNPEKFTSQHFFQLTEQEFACLKSQIETSKGRGGRRTLPYVFTIKGVARLATVLSTDSALHATDLLIDTFFSVRGQVLQGSSHITLPEASHMKTDKKMRQQVIELRQNLFKALDALLKTIIDVEAGKTVEEKGKDLASEALKNLQERLRKKGLDNAKLEADTELVLAEAQKRLADARKTHAEADAIDIANLERKIGVVKNILELSREAGPVEFVDLLDEFSSKQPLAQLPSLKEGQE